MIKCPNCRDENKDSARFCRSCGKPLDPSARPFEQLVTLEAELIEKVREVEQLTAKIKELEKKMTQQTATNKVQSGTIDQQFEEITQLTKEMEDLKGKVVSLNAEIAELNKKKIIAEGAADAEKVRNAKWKKMVWYAAGIILLCVLGVAVGSGIKNKKDKALMKEVVMLPSNIKDKLPGFYMLQRKSVGGNTEKLTSEIKEKEGVYGIRIVTDYGPEYHYFTVEGSSLKSETLGQGTIKYKQSVDKIILSFTSNSIVWEFVK